MNLKSSTFISIKSQFKILRWILFIILTFTYFLCFGQESKIFVDFSSKNWKTLGKIEIKEYDGKLATCVPEGTGMAYLDGFDFENGIIECDLFAPVNRAFIGLVFRIGSLSNLELIHCLPHESCKWDAVEYNPIFNQSATWQLYHGKGNEAPAKIPTNEWFHIKIVVIGDTAKVYLHNETEATLAVKLKHKITQGPIGVFSHHPGIFANLSVTKIDTNYVKAKEIKKSLVKSSYLTRWLISEPFNNANWDSKKLNLNDSLKGNWQIINAEEGNLINLNRYYVRSGKHNTILAKVIIDSKKEQTKKLYFGYSDKIKIFLNSNMIFSGDNSYKESDRWDDRGYVFDDNEIVELLLKKGKNELIMQIYEEQFGWGFKAHLEDLKDITNIQPFNK